MGVQVEQLITEHLDLWTQAQTAKSTSGRGSNHKIELTGIKKLRELILELAVRGKLVPQDPNDEPASELLKRTAAEKEALVKAEKLKKQKPLPHITDEVKPFDLPLGWSWSSLQEISEINPRNQANDETQVSFVPMALVSTTYKGEHQTETRTWGEVKKGFTHFKNGDIGIAKITPCFENSKAVIFSNLTNSIGAGTTELHIARPYTDMLSPLFILLNLKSPVYLKIGESKMTGTAGQKRLPKDFFESYPLPVPPLNEQTRIVAKVDELMALCDQLEQQSYQQLDAHNQLVDALLATLTQSQNADELASNWQRLAAHFDTLFTTEYSIDALKQTILQLAVMGKLVKQDPNDEPASELLKRIAAEKDALVKAGKIKKQKPLPPISAHEKPFELPEGWEWCRLDNLSLSSEAGWSPQCDNLPRENNYWGVLKVSAVTWGSYNESENKALPSHLEPRPEFEVKPNDFLISRANTADLVARAVVVPNDAASNLMLSDKIIRFKFSELISINYVNLVNGSFHARQYYSQVAGGTSSSMKNVSRVQIQNLVIPLPPLREQEKILIKVKELEKFCDGLVCKLISVKQTQAVLADALIEQVVA